ncbi:Immunoglobulin A1 protease [Salix suchowensis]|nr:Immunoglobulin A1 protease [Salix suchowensis]
MSAIVCGKRSFFEELTVSSPPVSKRIRCSSSSPVRYSPPRSNTLASNPASFNLFSSSASSSSAFIEQLAAIFPDMDNQLLEKALEECGDDLDSAIRSLNELRLASVENFCSAVVKSDVIDKANVPPQGLAPVDSEAHPTEDPSASAHLSMDGMEWVELFVREMTSASNIDDARARASRALEALEKSICTRAGAETAKSFNQENMMLKEQMQALIQENTILKRAVSIQHERQKEFEESSQELQQLKQLVSQYQDQLRTLEVNNYALTLHLKQAQQSSSMPGRFHPDVF